MTRALRIAIVAAVPALLALHTIDAADIWAQLATGRFVAAHGLPAQDPFGAPPPAPWLVHDWLASVLLWALHAVAGAPGLVVLATVACAGAVALPLVRAARAGSPLVPFEIAALLATLVAYERFFVRPEILTFFLATVWTQALAAGRPHRWRDVATLALAQCLWANVHAAFVLGPALAALAVAGDVLDARFRSGAWSRPAGPRLALPFVAVAAACIHPYGPRILAHALAAGGEGAAALRRGIAEWQPTFAAGSSGDITILAFAASLVFVAAAAWRGRLRLRTFEVLAVLLFAVLAWSARRHLALYAVAALPLAAAWWARAPLPAMRLQRRVAAWLPALVAALLALDIARGRFYARFGPPRVLGFGVSQQDHALGAAEFVAHNALPGPVFNNIAAGGVLMARVGPALPVFVDGRLLDLERFRAYRRALESAPQFDALARLHGFRLVVLALQPNPPVGLFRHLATDAGWRLVFFDATGAVFVRADARPDLPRVALDRPLPGAGVGAAGGFWRTCDADPAALRGLVLARLGFTAAARADLVRARVHCPDRADVAEALAGMP